jgi:elongation factor G
LEQAQEDPSQLSQETIIQQLDPKEQARLDKVRNIGIAVGNSICLLQLPY